MLSIWGGILRIVYEGFLIISKFFTFFLGFAFLLIGSWGQLHARIVEGESSHFDGAHTNTESDTSYSSSECVESLRPISARALSTRENKQLSVVATTLKSILMDAHFPPRLNDFPKGGLIVEGSEATIKVAALSNNKFDFRLKFEITFSQSLYESRYNSKSLWDLLSALDEILRPLALSRFGAPNWILKARMNLNEIPTHIPATDRKPARLRWSAEYTFDASQYPMTKDQLAQVLPGFSQETEDQEIQGSSEVSGTQGPRVRPLKKGFMAFITSILNLAKYDLSED